MPWATLQRLWVPWQDHASEGALAASGVTWAAPTRQAGLCGVHHPARRLACPGLCLCL